MVHRLDDFAVKCQKNVTGLSSTFLLSRDKGRQEAHMEGLFPVYGRSEWSDCNEKGVD